MRRLAVLLATLCALAVSACTASTTNGNGTYRYTSASAVGTVFPAARRKPLEQFTGTLLSGGTTTLAKLRSKVLVLNFWASWCGPCQIETPQYDALYRQLKARGVNFVGIDIKDVRSNAQSFVRNNDISYPMIYDEDGALQVKLGNVLAQGPPFTMLIDRHGKVAAVYLQRMSDPDLQVAIDKLLAER